jgi:hypothetical protein
MLFKHRFLVRKPTPTTPPCYRVLLQQACKELEVLVAAALQLLEQQGGGGGRRKARGAAVAQDVEEWDPEQVRSQGM